MKGYEALRTHAAWYDLSARGRLRVTGEDRARLLHAMTTNNILALKPDEGCYAFFLNAQGRILSDVNVLCRPDHLLLGTEPVARQRVAEHLDRYIIADDAEVTDITEETCCLAVDGPQAEGQLRSLGAPIPESPYCSEEWGSRLVYKISDEQLRVIAPLGEKADLAARLGEEADADAVETVRLEHGRPKYGVDMTEKHLVQESRQLHAVHPAKGCYLGQEIVERVKSRGQVHKGLYAIRIEGEEVPLAGEILTDESGQKAADITSARYSPGLLTVVGLAYVRADAWNGSVRLRYRERSAQVTQNS